MTTTSYTTIRMPSRAGTGETLLQRAGTTIAAALAAARGYLRRAHARHLQRRRARAAYDALCELDDHVLRDLGFHRSEIGSVAAEISGGARPTRIRALQTLHDLSL